MVKLFLGYVGRDVLFRGKLFGREIVYFSFVFFIYFIWSIGFKMFIRCREIYWEGGDFVIVLGIRWVIVVLLNEWFICVDFKY